MSKPVVMVWDGVGMMPVPAAAALCAEQYTIGEKYLMDEVRGRSMKSHDHFFVTVAELWATLPEAGDGTFPTAEHLRKFALIKAGYCDVRSNHFASKVQAERVATFIRPLDEFALVVTSAASVTVYTAQSQSIKAMGGKVFQESKAAVLDIIAAMLGVSADQLPTSEAA